MKRLLAGVLSLVLCTAAYGQAEAPAGYWNETGLALSYWFPGVGDFDLYKSGFGIEVQYHYWVTYAVGVAASAGWCEWDADSGAADLGVPVDGGSITFMPLGASLLYKLVDVELWNLTLEAGARLALVDSDVKLADGRKLEIDDGIVAVAGIEYSLSLTENWSVQAALRYQEDVQKGEILGGDLRDNELQGLAVALGTRIRF